MIRMRQGPSTSLALSDILTWIGRERYFLNEESISAQIFEVEFSLKSRLSI